MTLMWNLMSRASNALRVCYSHMFWAEDALAIYFSHQKNDQMGEKPRDPRHIYANPFMPEICPVLALGVYWMCFEVDSEDAQLYPGKNQYERFRKILKRCAQLDEIAEELEGRGIDPDDLGLHSWRKGSLCFCASGSTACPSGVACQLRAGWNLPGVQDTYYRYEAAGDMHVGRTVSGLPTGKPEFAILPPMFTVRGYIIIESIFTKYYC
jgi:hypothetical protein